MGSVFGPLLLSTLYHSSFAIILMGERELVALVVFLTSCDCWCSVAFPHVALSKSAVFDCGIF